MQNPYETLNASAPPQLSDLMAYLTSTGYIGSDETGRMNRPWTYDSDATRTGQGVVDMYKGLLDQWNAVYGNPSGHPATNPYPDIQSLPVTPYAASLPANNKESGGFFSGGIGKGLLMAGLAAAGGWALAPEVAGGLSVAGDAVLPGALGAEGLGAGAVYGGASSVLPESYWSMGADAGGAVTDAAAANAGTVAEGATQGGGFNMDYFTNTPTSSITSSLVNAGVDPSKALQLAQALSNGSALNGVPWGQLAQAAGSLLGGAAGAGAAKTAAGIQSAATDRAVAQQGAQFAQSRADLAPYREAGTAALTRLRGLLGMDGGSGQLLKKFGPDDLAADVPYNTGLQFGLDEGTKAIERRAASKGSYDSGGTLKELTRFGNDYGNQRAGDAYNRFTGEQDRTFGKLSGVAGMGSGATTVGVNAGENNSSTLSSLYAGQGNANAAATIAGSNAIANGINTASNNYNQYNLLSQLTGGGARAVAA